MLLIVVIITTMRSICTQVRKNTWMILCQGNLLNWHDHFLDFRDVQVSKSAHTHKFPRQQCRQVPLCWLPIFTTKLSHMLVPTTKVPWTQTGLNWQGDIRPEDFPPQTVLVSWRVLFMRQVTVTGQNYEKINPLNRLNQTVPAGIPVVCMLKGSFSQLVRSPCNQFVAWASH